MKILYLGKKDKVFSEIEIVLKEQNYDVIEVTKKEIVENKTMEIYNNLFDNYSGKNKNIVFVIEEIDTFCSFFKILDEVWELTNFYKFFDGYIFNKIERDYENKDDDTNYLRIISNNIQEIESNDFKHYFTFLQDESKERTKHILKQIKEWITKQQATTIKIIDATKLDEVDLPQQQQTTQNQNQQNESKSQKLKEVSQSDNIVKENITNKKNNEFIKFNQKEHLTYYKKYKLNKDVSIRYFYIFDDRKDLKKQWVLKSHSTKKMIKLNKNQAQKMLEIFGVDKYTEIRGKSIGGNQYEKVIIKSNGRIERIVEEN